MNPKEPASLRKLLDLTLALVIPISAILLLASCGSTSSRAVIVDGLFIDPPEGWEVVCEDECVEPGNDQFLHGNFMALTYEALYDSSAVLVPVGNSVNEITAGPLSQGLQAILDKVDAQEDIVAVAIPLGISLSDCILPEQLESVEPLLEKLSERNVPVLAPAGVGETILWPACSKNTLSVSGSGPNEFSSSANIVVDVPVDKIPSSTGYEGKSNSHATIVALAEYVD